MRPSLPDLAYQNDIFTFNFVKSKGKNPWSRPIIAVADRDQIMYDGKNKSKFQ
jgi:hypothetical protein